MHPAAADTLGVNVTAIRYICTIASGMFAGLGGAAMTLGVVSNFSQSVISGQGFIALAAVIPYNMFMARAERIGLDIEEAAAEMVDFISMRAERDARKSE